MGAGEGWGMDADSDGGAASRVRGVVGDGVLLLAAVVLFPLIILLVGTPIALAVRAVIEIARRFS